MISLRHITIRTTVIDHCAAYTPLGVDVLVYPVVGYWCSAPYLVWASAGGPGGACLSLLARRASARSVWVIAPAAPVGVGVLGQEVLSETGIGAWWDHGQHEGGVVGQG